MRASHTVRPWGVALFILVAIARPALADDRRGDWEVGLDTMYMYFGTGSFESNLDAGGRVALRTGCFVTDFFQLEAQVSYANSQGDCNLLACTDIETTLKTRFVNGVVNLPKVEGMTPYVYAGVGRARLDFDGDVEVEDEGPAYQAGVGVRIESDRLGARLEVLFIQEDLFDDRSTHVGFGAGFIFRPGGKP